MHFKYVAITFATYAISNVLAAPVASPEPDVRFAYSPVSLEVLRMAQEDANAQLTSNGNDKKEDTNYEAKPAYNQPNGEHPPQKPQEGTQHPEDQKDVTNEKPVPEDKNKNNEVAAPAYVQNTVDTTKDENNDQDKKDQLNAQELNTAATKGQNKGQEDDDQDDKDQLNAQELSTADTKGQNNGPENNDQLDEQKLNAVDTKDQAKGEETNEQQLNAYQVDDTEHPQDTKMPSVQHYAAQPSYDQWQSQGQGQSHGTGSGYKYTISQGGSGWHRQQTYRYRYGGAYSVSECEFHGDFLCNGLELFGICDRGLVIWQPVALGTACRNGGIGYA